MKRQLNRLPAVPFIANGEQRRYSVEVCAALGLTEGLLLEQLIYWLERTRHHHDGRYWVYNSYKEWQQQFPWWSVTTIKRAFLGLEQSGLVLAANYNRSQIDTTKWYSVDFDRLRGALEAWAAEHLEPVGHSDPSMDQIDPSDGPDRSIGQTKLDSPIPETTTETNQRGADRPVSLEDRARAALDPRSVQPRRPG